MKGILLVIIVLVLSLYSMAQVNDSINNHAYIVNSIDLIGNKVTNDEVILREMEFEAGDTISASEFYTILAHSRRNILSRSIFNFAEYEVLPLSDTSNDYYQPVDVIFNLTERWYVWPIPYLKVADRNFNAWLEKMDFRRLSLGFYLNHCNLGGNINRLYLTSIFGYNQDFGLTFECPYLDKKMNFGMGIGGGFKRDREVAYGTIADKLQYFESPNDFAARSYYLQLSLQYYHGFHNRHHLNLEFRNISFSDSLAALNPDFGNADGNCFKYFVISYIYKNDYRDDRSYPLDGHYFDLELTKYGLGMFRYTPNSFSVKTAFDWYTPIKERFYWASNITLKLTAMNDMLYFVSQGYGYQSDVIRSLELYCIDGKHFAISKNNLKYCLMRPKVFNVPLGRDERFFKLHFAVYCNLFLDAGYVFSEQPSLASTLQNRFLYGGGFGFDFVTYYDKVMRIEYSVNMLGESGLFLSFVAPI